VTLPFVYYTRVLGVCSGLSSKRLLVIVPALTVHVTYLLILFFLVAVAGMEFETTLITCLLRNVITILLNYFHVCMNDPILIPLKCIPVSKGNRVRANSKIRIFPRAAQISFDQSRNECFQEMRRFSSIKMASVSAVSRLIAVCVFTNRSCYIYLNVILSYIPRIQSSYARGTFQPSFASSLCPLKSSTIVFNHQMMNRSYEAVFFLQNSWLRLHMQGDSKVPVNL
jgi:hypothetical protein